MRYIKYGLIFLAVLILLVLILFFRPEPASLLKSDLYEHSYIAGTFKTRYLLERPVTTIISSIPGGKSSIPGVPFFFKPLIPPTAELYVLKNVEGGGWAAAIDLGWRSRLFRRIHGIIMNQMQYRGFGAIEGKSILRTPTGVKIIVYQDKGTLFIGEGEHVVKSIMYPAQGGSVKSSVGLSSQVSDKRDMAYLLFVNNDKEFSKVIEGMEQEKGFQILPSVNSLRGGTIKIRRPTGSTLIAELSLLINDNGDITGVENDLGYLADLIDRILSTNNLKVDKTINKENGNITAQVMIHPVGGPK
ncbi:MAG: hypothetical protein HZA08_05435 [Nitrospirae bacterium]|nr:hypothetical protein [Nitrospirota bacterium]